MSPEKMSPAESAGSRSASPPARKKRRRWKRALLLLLLTVAAGIAFAPRIIAHTSLRNSAIARVHPKLDGKLLLGQTSLGWFSPVEVKQVQLLHADGERWATIENLKSEYSLLDLLLEPSDLGRWTASQCEVTAVCEPGTTDVERWLEEIGSEEETAPAELSFETEKLLLTLKSAGVESQFQLTGGRYQQNLAGDISFEFRGSPLQQEQDHLTVAARFDEGVSWSFSGSGFPLEQLEPLLVRFERNERIAARMSGGLAISRDKERTWSIESDGNLSQLQLQAGDLQVADVDSLDLKLGVRQTESGWHVSTLDGKTDFGNVTLEGEIDLPADSRSWPDTLDHLLDQSFALNGTVELGNLTQRFPSLLTLQEGVKLNQGTCDFQLQSRPEQNRRLLITTLDVSEIDAETPTQAIRWDHPFHANATVGQEDGTWKIDSLKIDSKSVSLTGSGTWESAELDADIDLAAFAQEWSRIFDLSELQLAGTLQAHAESRIQSDRQIELNGNLTGKTLLIGWGTARPWELAILKGDIEGTGTIDDAGEFALTKFRATVHTEKELLTLTRLNPQELMNADQQQWQLSGSGDMTGLAGQWLSRNTNLRLSGTYRVETEWLHDRERDQFQKLDLEFRNFEVISGNLSIAEPQLKITGDLSVETAANRIASEELVVNCPTVAARLNEFNLSTEPGLRVSGKLAARGRVERLWYYVDTDLEAANPTGFLNLQLVAVSEPNNDTGLNWKVTTEELRWPAAAANPVRPVSHTGAAADSVKAAIAPVWTGSGRYLSRDDQLVIEESKLTGDALNFNLQGRVAGLTSAPVASIEGVCRYDWEQLTQRYPGLLGRDLKLYGSHQSPLNLTFPLSGGRAGRNQMAGSVSVIWDRGEWNALPIGGGTLRVDLSPERLKVKPVEVSVAGGTAKFGPAIERSSNGAVLLQTPERLVDRVQLTDEICHEWLKYISPLTADAARVRGSFTVDNTEVLQVPLDRWQQMSGEGLVQIHTAEMRPGPLAMQFITLSKQIEALRRGTPFDPQAVDPEKPLITIARQAVPCKVQDGRVYHKDLTMLLGDLSVTSSGSVGFDDTLDLVANIEIPEKWKIRGKPVREIWGANIQIPIRGTISRAAMDPRVIQSLMDQLVRGTVTNFLEEELNKQLKKLFQK